MKFSLLIFLLSFTLFAQDLEKIYYVSGGKIKLSTIVEHPKKDTVLFEISNERYSKRVKSKQLIQMLKNYGYTFDTKHSYVTFLKKSPVDVAFVKEYVKKYYQKIYPNIKINSIDVHPRAYIKQLPYSKNFKIPTKAYLKNSGIISVVYENRKQIFLNYTIDATLDLFVASKDIARVEEISFVNTTKKSIIVQKFKAMPLLEIPNGAYESKYKIPKGTLLTHREVAPLKLVKRGESINVFLQSAGLSISFSAKALSNGKLGDMIKIEMNDGKRLKARVTGRNRAKVI